MNKSSRIIVAIDTSQAWGRGVVHGIMNYVEQHRVWDCYFCLIGGFIGDAVGRAPSADGILVDSRYAGSLAKGLKVPGVEVGYEPGGNLPAVTIDYEKIAQMAADHLLSRGFQRFAYFNYSTPASKAIGSAFQRKIEAAGCSFEWFELVQWFELNDGETKHDWPREPTQLVRWVERLKKPVAVLAPGDASARELALACRAAGVEVPREIAILGMSNDEMRCFLCNPYLSSIDIGARQAGYIAAELLAKLIKGEPPAAEPVVVPPVRVIVRESTDIIAAADDHVVAAFKYIEENLSKGANVKGMLREVKVGRRTLEVAFRKYLGRTIHEEIIRAQLQKATHLLVHSSWNLEQIAAECGMGSGSNLGAFFKKHMGMTPLQYRMAHRQSYGDTKR